MQTGEILRAKSIQAEVAYRVEMKRTTEAHTAVASHKALVDRREQQVWREAIRQRGNAEPGGCAGRPASVGIERLDYALRELSNARAQHAASAQVLRQQLGVVAMSQTRRDLLQAMLAAFHRRSLNQRESRRADDVAELAATSRAKICSAQRLSRAGGENENCDTQPVCVDSSVGRRVDSGAPLRFASALWAIPPGESTGALAAPIEISSLCSEASGERVSLSVSCSIGGIGAVGLRVIKSESGEGVRALIDPNIGALAARIVADKGGVLARLQGLGIKLASIDIGVDDASGDGAPTLPQRRASRTGDLYEDDVA